MKKKLLIVLVLVLVLVMCSVMFVACVKPNDDPSNITFALDWAPNTNHIGLYMAQELGYYSDAGLNVDIVQIGDMGASIPVANGSAQFGVDFQEQMAINYSKGIPVTAVSSIIQTNTSGILSLKSSNIDSPKDMAGKVYVTMGNPVEQAIIEYIIANDGGGELGDKFYHYDYVTDPIASMLIGDIDCAWVYEGWDFVRAELEYPGQFNYFPISDFGVHGDLDWYTPVIIANNEYLSSYPDKAKAFISATQKGYMYAVTNPDAAAELFCKAVPEFASEKALIGASVDLLAPLYKGDAPQWGHIDAVRWNSFYGFINDENLAEGTLPDNYAFSNAYLPKI